MATTINTERTGGRGARERILAATEELFYAQGVNSTGMAQLAESAHVSKRTLYQHFPTKDELIEACLRRFEDDEVLGNELALKRTDVPPIERLLMLFAAPRPGVPLRGCLFSNTAVEIADIEHPARRFVADHKRRFAQQATEIARDAGASDPEDLGEQLAILFDGASARSVALGDVTPYEQARAVAEILLNNALSPR